MKSTLAIFALFLASTVLAERYGGLSRRRLVEGGDVDFPEFTERLLMHRRSPHVAFEGEVPSPNRRLGWKKWKRKFKKIKEKVKKIKVKIKKYKDKFGRICDIASVVGYTCPGKGILYDQDDEDDNMAYPGWRTNMIWNMPRPNGMGYNDDDSGDDYYNDDYERRLYVPAGPARRLGGTPSYDKCFDHCLGTLRNVNGCEKACGSWFMRKFGRWGKSRL